MSNLIKRTVPVILVLVVCITCLVSPVSATSVDDSLVDLLDYQESDSIFIGGTDTFSYNFTIPTTSFYYFDAIVRSSIPDFSVTVDGFECQVLPIYGQYYRIVWSGSTSASSIPIIFNGSGYFFVNIVRAQISTVPFTPIPESLYYTGYNSVFDLSSFSGTVTPGSSVTLPAYPEIIVPADVYELHDFALTLYPDNWQNYDQIMIYLKLNVISIDSILATVNDQNVLGSISYIDNSSFVEDETSEVNKNNTSHFMVITLDLSSVDHSISSSLFVNIWGKYVVTDTSVELGKIFECNGLLLNKDSDAQFYWFRKIWSSITNGFSNLNSNLSSWFNNQLSYFKEMLHQLELLNGDSADAVNAQQTQEEINVSINNQLVGAVEDWNTNIEVVETGYDMAFSKTTPALVWLASLADGIFNGMGWFGNVYFLVGLISVIMLVLSKSGLAHKIGSISRRKGD